MGALTRRWSTFLNGIQTDETKFRIGDRRSWSPT